MIALSINKSFTIKVNVTFLTISLPFLLTAGPSLIYALINYLHEQSTSHIYQLKY